VPELKLPRADLLKNLGLTCSPATPRGFAAPSARPIGTLFDAAGSVWLELSSLARGCVNGGAGCGVPQCAACPATAIYPVLLARC